ncbi:MAG: aminotransferase class V-fold PLP-dependent enzyme [Candidatus Saccharibacteria bacterium]|nr:aminotransferase class V-fold PLP-dependent enzyme [Candidatus Saccharibacteria bacterium]
MAFFRDKNARLSTGNGQAISDFDYLSSDHVYFDAACQSLRPQQVTEVMVDYYTKFNSCGERVKYRWGLEVDEKIEATRAAILKLLKLSPRKYFVSFTQNTTYGLNLILGQLRTERFERIITSDIEHNSVFLSTLTCANKNQLERVVLERQGDGSIDLSQIKGKAIVVLNAVSNIDGQQLTNIKDVVKRVHDQHGLVIIDAAQAMSHYFDMLAGVEADAICFSSHKMYGPSLGVIVAKRSLIDDLDINFVGGGMVDDVTADGYKLLVTEAEHIHTVFEAGLQSYAEIIGLGAAIKWLEKHHDAQRTLNLAEQLIDFLRESPHFHVLNQAVTPTIAFYHDKYDSHLLAQALSDQDIMARSGYFCAHYYLHHQKDYPSLVRLSLGLHNRQSDVDKFIDVMKGLTK